MSFTVTYGEPEIAAFRADFEARFALGSLSPAELRTFKKLVKLLALLSQNPRHPGLQSHEIKVLSSTYGVKIFEFHLEKNTPSAGRLWAGGPLDRNKTSPPSPTSKMMSSDVFDVDSK